MKVKRLKLECFGGPLCGSYAPDSMCLWFCCASRSRPGERHYYKQIKCVDCRTSKSLLIWHYHGMDPDGPGMKPIRPASRKFK